MDKNKTENLWTMIYEWLPIVLIVIGVLFKLLHIDAKGLFINTGFILYGIVGLIDGISKRYYEKFGMELINIAIPVIFILLAVDNILVGNNFPAVFAILAIVGQQNRKRKIDNSTDTESTKN
jgi:hypothetical protein